MNVHKRAGSPVVSTEGLINWLEHPRPRLHIHRLGDMYQAGETDSVLSVLVLVCALLGCGCVKLASRE